MKNIYLVTVASKTPNVARFATSLSHISHQVEHISVQFQPFIEEFPATNKIDAPYCGNLKRFEYVPKIDDGKFIIFSDTDDVLFQREIPDLERMPYEVYLGNENVKHGESYWKGFIDRNPYFEVCRNQPVYNGGLFIMRGHIFRKMVSFFKEFLVWVREEDRGQADQMLLNLFFIKNTGYDVYRGLDMIAPLYRNMELGLVRTRKGLFYLNDGHVPFAIHANGNTKGVLVDGRKFGHNTKGK